MREHTATTDERTTATNELTYLHGAHLGSASLATNANGAKITGSDARYFPYGAMRPGLEGATLPTDRRYTGQRWEDGIGLYDYNARYYDPALGRFISADTLVPNPGDPQSLNRYAYVQNNPLKYTDPSGHWLDTVIDIAGIAYDIHEIKRDGWNWINGAALAVDVVCLVVPIAAGGGMAVRAVAHADDAVDVVRAVNRVDDVADAARAVERVGDATDAIHAADTAGDALDAGNVIGPNFFNRTIDRAPNNPRNYTLRPSDVADGGLGLSTISDSVPSGTVLQETGRRRLVQIPADDIPTGFQWAQTPGHYGNPILDSNHWELWHPDRFQELPPGEYVNWWNGTIAPWLAEKATHWSVVK